MELPIDLALIIDDFFERNEIDPLAFQPLITPIPFISFTSAVRTTARIAAFIPGASPPEGRTTNGKITRHPAFFVTHISDERYPFLITKLSKSRATTVF